MEDSEHDFHPLPENPPASSSSKRKVGRKPHHHNNKHRIKTSSSHNPQWILMFLTSTQFVLYLDGGSLPIVLGDIKIDFGMNFVSQGVIGGCLFLFLAIGCPLVPVAAKYLTNKMMMLYALLACFFFNVMFTFTPAPWTAMLVVARSLIGFTHAFFIVNSPVWVDKHAPSDHMTRWMALLQSSIPMGTMVGYVMGSIAEGRDGCGTLACWRYPFIAQSVLMVPLIIWLFFIPDHHLDKSLGNHAEAGGYNHDAGAYVLPTDQLPEQHEAELLRYPSTCMDLRLVMNNRVFVLEMLSLTGLYFVVVCVQFWSPTYLLVDFNMPVSTVFFAIIAVTISAPAFGLYFGGLTIDQQGGYQGITQQKKTMRSVMYLASGAILGALTAVLAMGSFWVTVTGIWILLFFGSMLVPSLTGIMINSLEVRNRSLGSAVSMTMFNLFGWFLGPVASSLFMQLYEDYEVGFKVVMGFSLFPLFTSYMAYRGVVRDSEGLENYWDDPMLQGEQHDFSDDVLGDDLSDHLSDYGEEHKQGDVYW